MTRKLTFTEVAHSPIARLESGVAVVAGLMYVMGGHLGPDLRVTHEMHVYDPKADQWSRQADMPSAVTHIIAAVQNDQFIWIAGGYEGNHPGKGVTNVWRYDTKEDQWHAQTPLPEIRASGGLVIVNNHLHLFSGLGADRITNFAEHWALSLDQPDQWKPHAAMPDPRGHFSAAALNNKIYAMGGHFFHDEPGGIGEVRSIADLDLVDCYDPATDQWQHAAEMPIRRSHAEPATVTHQGRIILIGGRNNSPDALPERKRRNPMYIPLRAARKLKRIINSPPYEPRVTNISAYDIASNTWSHLGDLPISLYAPAAGVIDDTLIVTNGGTDKWRDSTDKTWIAKLI
jgi:N-acetylneuraminic acid mutarotase